MSTLIVPSKRARVYNCRRAKLSNAHLRSVFRAPRDQQFPAKFDIAQWLAPNKDQGQEGSCTANSLTSAAESLRKVLGLPDVGPFSRQLLYALEREDDGSGLGDDAGSSITESVNAAEKYGLALEKDWPYDPSHFSMPPTPDILAEALKYLVASSSAVAPTINDIKAAIMELRVVLYGFTCFESLEGEDVEQTGIIPMPQPGEGVLGGHANHYFGWDDDMTANGSTGFFKTQNSWGPTWGVQGNGFMPFDYVRQQLATDFHRLGCMAA